MAEKEFKDIGEAVSHIETKMKEYKEAATKEAGDKAMAEVTKMLGDQEKKAKEEHDKFVKEAADAGATIKQIQDEVKELKIKGGRKGLGNSKGEAKGLRQQIMMGIEDAIREKATEIKASAGGSLMSKAEIKAVDIASSSLSGDNYISYLDWQPGMEPTGQFHFRTMVRTILSETDFVQFPRANIPIGAGSFGRVTEAVAKPQVDRGYTMIDLTLKPMAAFAIASRQSLRNIIFLQSWLPQSLMNQMEESEDTDFANSLVSAATGNTTTTKTVVPEKLISYVKNLIKAKYNPNAVTCDPDIWEDLITFRPGTDNPYSLPGGWTQPVVGITPNGGVTLLGRPVYPVNWLTGRRVIVGDWTKAGIVQSEGLVMRQSDSHASIFTTNEIAFLLERTEGLAIFRTDAFVTAVL